MLGFRIQRPLFAPRHCCFRTKLNFSVSSFSRQVLQRVDQDCDEDFLPWLRQKAGVEISSVLSIRKSIYGRSLFASKPIQAGDCILKIPYSVQLYSDGPYFNCIPADNLHHAINSLLGDNISNVAKLAIVILVQKKLGQDSGWAPYIRCLPQAGEINSTIFWSDEELRMIQISSLYHETLKLKAQIEKDFSSIRHVLDRFPEFFEDVTLDNFKHAYNLVESRAWSSTRGVSMIPFADFLNHDGFSETVLLDDDLERVSEVTADQNYAPGDQVLIRYGKFSNIALLLGYGFTLPHNKYDQVQVVVDVPQHVHLRAMKLELLERHLTPALKDVNDFSSSRNCFTIMKVNSATVKGKGIPQSLRAFARVLCCTSPQELQDLAIEAAQNDGRLARIPLKNKSREMQAHQFLLLRINQIIEDYTVSIESLKPPSSPRLCEKHARRMQLARDLLTGELQILVSASAWLKNYCESLKGLSKGNNKCSKDRGSVPSIEVNPTCFNL